MKIDTDVLLFATRLVDEMGEAAIRISRVRLVELTATNNLRAAAFWRDVMRASEQLLAERPAALVPGVGQSPPQGPLASGGLAT